MVPYVVALSFDLLLAMTSLTLAQRRAACHEGNPAVYSARRVFDIEPISRA